jgi:competence protein ComEA
MSGLQQKGLFIFLFLILCFLGFRYEGLSAKPGLKGKTSLPGEDIIIEIKGEVNRPGLLSYPQPPTVQQVIRDAGGVSSLRTLSPLERKEEETLLEEDLALNISTKNSGKIMIEKKALSGKALWILGKPIPLNQATIEDLDQLPGIGPGLAERIVEYRQAHQKFRSVNDLMEVKGIKDKMFQKIKGYFTLS